MLHWYAPYPLFSGLEQRLSDAEVVKGTPDDQSIDLWIYDSPDRLLASWMQHNQCAPTTQELVMAYSSLVCLPAGSRLISGWRLEQLDPASLNAWLLGDCAILADVALPRELQPAIKPLEGQLLIRILEDFPNVLESYLDLELRAELVGYQPDSTYLERLLHTCTPEALLESWNVLHAGSLERFEQVKSERDETLADRNKLLAERDALLAERDALLAEHANLTCKLVESKEDAELTILQLHEAQEELEKYLLVYRDQANLLDKQNKLTENAIKMASGSTRKRI
jgi:hypothetical protein